jgi:DNA polymerase III subunit gamma/tau
MGDSEDIAGETEAEEAAKATAAELEAAGQSAMFGEPPKESAPQTKPAQSAEAAQP